MAKYTVLDFAEDILKLADKPLVYQEIWDAGKGSELEQKLALKGKTPWQTLGARLFVDARDNPDSRFIKVGKNPTRFFLKVRQSELTEEQVIIIEKEQKPPAKAKKYGFPERKLHPLLSYFAYANVTFNRGKQIYTKRFTTRNQKRNSRVNGFTLIWLAFIYRSMIGMINLLSSIKRLRRAAP